MNISKKLRNEIIQKPCIQRFKGILEEEIKYRKLDLSEMTSWDYVYEVYLIYKEIGSPFDQNLSIEQCLEWKGEKEALIGKGQFSKKTLAKKIVPLNHYLHLCCDCPENAIPQVKHISRAKEQVCLEHEDILKLVQYAESKKKFTEGMLIYVTYVTASRRGVIPTIKISDIKEYEDKGTIILRGCKGNKDLIVPVAKDEIRRIMHYVEHHRQQPKPGYEDILFLKKDGTPISEQKLRTALKYCARGLDIQENIHPHTLRYSRVRYCWKVLKMKVPQIVKITGHVKKSTLMDDYMLDEDIEEVHRILNANNIESPTEPQQKPQSDVDKQIELMKLKLQLAQEERGNLQQAKTNLEMQMQLKEEIKSVQPLNADQKGYG